MNNQNLKTKEYSFKTLRQVRAALIRAMDTMAAARYRVSEPQKFMEVFDLLKEAKRRIEDLLGE